MLGDAPTAARARRQRLYAVSPQLLLHACIHRTSGFSAEDFDRFQRLALEKQVGMLCLDALAVCQYYFRTTYPEGYLTALTRNHRREPSARLLHASKPRWVLADLLALNRPHERLAFAAELLFPPHLAATTGWLPKTKAWMARLLSGIG